MMMLPRLKNSAILLISCPDQKGLNAAIADFIFRNDGNILHADEHQDEDLGLFLMRVEWDLAGFALDMREFDHHFVSIATKFGMEWRVALSAYRPSVAIFVSKFDHCLADLLYRHRSGELACDIPLIISNHPDVQALADFYRVPLHVVPVTKENKSQAEAAELALLSPQNIDLIVLARYMQVLSPDFIRHFPHRIINIHQFVSSRFRRRKAASPGVSAWSEAHRRHWPLRHRGSRRWTDHRAGCCAHFASRYARRLDPEGKGS